MSSSASLVDRMIRAAKLDSDLYEEVEADTSANRQAFMVVLITSLAAGIGVAFSNLISGDESNSYILWGFLSGLGFSVIGWLLWALVVYIIGITIFKTGETEADYGQLLRTLGFATTPDILGVFLFIPVLGGLLAFIAFIWKLVAGVIAVRQALDFSTWRAVGTCILGLIPYLLFSGLLAVLIL